ncbi:hypothetical protein P5F55_13785 [Clostridium perfringens]|uniref:hypothetical protein n=1 Tax=Clostridium perfringens TaxID=1502 RepID=UPI0029712CD5|nr:hypothetical protein [Clostridium perfringens]MDK0835024.1 hypothetical protein [Clostridium perfringens]MDK0928432.1 hypothetical protein [Clostridium perfringens]MDM0495344.1 hypothetical protein [Clostridium perfringens]MDM0781060.1 hypothetical protein [Clostridium perfringens]
MRVSRKPKNRFCGVGDVVSYNHNPYMVVERKKIIEGNSTVEYLLVGLEGESGGKVGKVFETLFEIDAHIEEVLISKGDVVICREGEN